MASVILRLLIVMMRLKIWAFISEICRYVLLEPPDKRLGLLRWIWMKLQTKNDRNYTCAQWIPSFRKICNVQFILGILHVTNISIYFFYVILVDSTNSFYCITKRFYTDFKNKLHSHKPYPQSLVRKLPTTCSSRLISTTKTKRVLSEIPTNELTQVPCSTNSPGYPGMDGIARIPLLFARHIRLAL